RQEHRLSALEMRKARRYDAMPVGSPLVKCLLQTRDLLDRVDDRVANEQAEIERNLIVTTAGGVKLAGGWSDQLVEAGFDVGVDVFQRVVETDLAARRFAGDDAKSSFDRLALGRLDN